MRIIDLLVKIANGEEVPKKIKYKSFILERTESSEVKRLYVDEQGMYFPEYYSFDLNDEVEIIEEEPRDIEVCGSLFTKSECDKLAGIKEDKKIERIGANNYKWNYKYDIKTPQAVVDNLELVRQKINEIIDYLEENK